MSNELKKLIEDSIKETPDKSVQTKRKEKRKVKDLDVYGGGTRVVDLKDFRFPKKDTWRIRTDVFQWNNRDIAIYINEKYYKKFDKKWEVSLVGVTTQANRIKKVIFDILGFCDTIVVKDYLDYFFQFWVDFKVIGKEKNLYFNSLLDKDCVTEFLSNYNYADRIKFYTSGGDSDYHGKMPSVKYEDIEQSYYLGIDSLVVDYGIIIAMNFLLKQGKDMDSSLKLVLGAIKRVFRDSDSSVLLDITNSYSPYSDKMIFKDHEKISKLVRNKFGKEVEFNVVYLNNINRWKYFERDNEE